MTASIYLFFDGDCAEAFRSYAKHLGGTIGVLLAYDATPAAATVPEHWGKKIIHGRMMLDGLELLASDAPPGRYSRPQGFTVTLNTGSDAEAERIFAALSDGGAVREPMAETFFATRYGTLTDRFAVPWMVLCERRPVP